MSDRVNRPDTWLQPDRAASLSACTRGAVHTWVADADRRDGRREPKPAAVDVALTSTERDELARLRRENKQLRLEREILSRAAGTPSHMCDGNLAWFARETGVVPPSSSHS